MKIDKTTYKDIKERIIGMTADHTSRPDKVLFFADPHFFKTILASRTNGTFGFSRHTSQPFAKPKEPFFVNVLKNFNASIK
jgi:hypothetical protein